MIKLFHNFSKIMNFNQSWSYLLVHPIYSFTKLCYSIRCFYVCRTTLLPCFTYVSFQNNFVQGNVFSFVLGRKYIKIGILFWDIAEGGMPWSYQSYPFAYLYIYVTLHCVTEKKWNEILLKFLYFYFGALPCLWGALGLSV